jgi:hypothetical protein
MLKTSVSEQKADENVDRVKELVLANVRITVCCVANVLGILFELVQTNLKGSLNVAWLTTKFVPYPLSGDQKKNCVSARTFKRDLKKTQSSVCHLFFPKTQDVTKGKELECHHVSSKIMGQHSARLQDVHFTKCFKWWCDDYSAHCVIKSQGDYLKVNSIDYKLGVVVMEK